MNSQYQPLIIKIIQGGDTDSGTVKTEIVNLKIATDNNRCIHIS